MKQKLKQKKDKSFVIWVAAILTLCAVGLVLTFGLKDGWDSVLAWFTGDYATILYIGIFVYLMFVLQAFMALFGEKEVSDYVSSK